MTTIMRKLKGQMQCNGFDLKTAFLLLVLGAVSAKYVYLL